MCLDRAFLSEVIVNVKWEVTIAYTECPFYCVKDHLGGHESFIAHEASVSQELSTLTQLYELKEVICYMPWTFRDNYI